MSTHLRGRAGVRGSAPVSFVGSQAAGLVKVRPLGNPLAPS